MFCLGIQSSAGAMVKVPKRAESVPAVPGAVTIASPRAARSDSVLCKKQKKCLDVRGRSYGPEFLMKEERTTEDEAMMGLVAQRLEADKSRRLAGALVMGAVDYVYKQEEQQEQEHEEDPCTDIHLPPLFPEEVIQAEPIKFGAQVDVSNIIDYEKPAPMYDKDDRESAKRMARLNKRFKSLKLKRYNPSKKAVTQHRKEEVAEPEDFGPVDLEPEDALQFHIDDI